MDFFVLSQSQHIPKKLFNTRQNSYVKTNCLIHSNNVNDQSVSLQ